MTEVLKFYKIYDEVEIPKFATEGSACFDVRAFVPIADTALFSKVPEHMIPKHVLIQPGERKLLSTGLIMDIPVGYHVKLYARSGYSFREGLIMTNSVGIIDSDYTDELKISVTNISDKNVHVNNGDRVAQGMMVKNESYIIARTTEPPQQKTDRVGGFGSTGTK